jgi:hypothetical protein
VLYRQLVDPCWPERYNYEARMATREVFNAQAQRGHVLDQTIWSHHFEKDQRSGDDLVTKDPKSKEQTVALTPGAKEHLKYLAFRKPVADPHIYLQRDLSSEVNFRRKVAIENYLATLVPGRPFVIEEIDERELTPVVLPPRYADEKGKPDPKAVELILPKSISGSTTSGGSGGGVGGQ